MASIRKEISINASPEQVWDAVRAVDQVHERLAPGWVVDVRRDADARILTLANGVVMRELLVDVDDKARRLAYAGVQGELTHHSASMQVVPDGHGTRLLWITDLLPNEAAPRIGAMIERGATVIKETLERKRARP